MKKTRPRGPIPSLISGGNGKPKRVTVKKKSNCSRCGVSFVAGMSCIEIPKVRSGFSNSKRFCDDCFQDILRKTCEDIEVIKRL